MQQNKKTNKIKFLKSFKAKKLLSCSAGFTIIETLVALSIFSFSILALLAVTSQGTANTDFSKNKLTASYLAEEGVEMVRNMRDSASLAGTTWNDSFHNNAEFRLSDCYQSGQSLGCDIDSETLTIFACPLSRSACENLGYDSSSGFYRSGSFASALSDSGFSRLITLRDIGNDEVNITSVVSWNQGTQSKNVTLSEDVFDWVTITPVPAPAPSPTPTPTPQNNPL